uniref:Ig-like domain-containing protein n=1 Tax=Esox lucius TaxID=8010 RepID=A0A6Q2ZD40_ESOLU
MVNIFLLCDYTTVRGIPLSLSICLFPAFLHISPDSSQFFEYDSLTVSCDVGWVVKRNTLKEETTECGNTWGKRNILDCVISSLRPRDSGQYWCESWSGDQSSTVNISVHGGHVILESPALPVTEGHSVTLNCRYKKTPSNLTADFYKDGSLIRNETTGEMTIPAVNKSDEGWYWCRHPIGNSSKSWITVSGQCRNIISPPSPGPTPRSPPSWTCLEHLPRETSWGHPYQMPEPPQLATFDIKEQRVPHGWLSFSP